ncbi:MAG: hypothetical protein J6J39_07325 [Clostridia bacterium]|nr:hypothetical protein [Oscillospiraceae bacterium]MBP3627827.1 hypothetical protein [Clostridia bacterium]
MKGCPICNKKYQDDVLKCNQCNIELMDWKIAERIYLYGYDNIKTQYPKEYQRMIKYRQVNGEKGTYKNSTTMSKAIPPQPKHQSEQNIPKCPTCGSTNIKHISTLNRAVSVGVFGLLSGKIGKNYECLNCKARW